MSELIDMATREERPPYVTFERRAIEDPAASAKAGHYVAVDVDYVKITPAYTKDVIIRDVASWFEKLDGDFRNGRIPPTWIPRYRAAYEAWKNGQELPLDGTPIRGWGVISPAMQEILCNMKVLTIEDAARMNDDAMKRIGMGAGDIRAKAQAALKAAKDTGPLVMENAKLRSELTVANQNIEALTENLTRLTRIVEGMNQAQAPQPDPVYVDRDPDPIAASDVLPETDGDDLVARYTAKFGKPPHHRMKRETILAELGE